jgi:hypothetical protein
MGIVKKSLTLALLTFGFASFANADTYKAVDNSIESKLCVAAATASNMKMNHAVRDFRPGGKLSSIGPNYKLVANNLYCNGVDVAEFALQAGNESVANKLLKYRSKNVEIRDLAKARHGSVKITN